MPGSRQVTRLIRSRQVQEAGAGAESESLVIDHLTFFICHFAKKDRRYFLNGE